MILIPAIDIRNGQVVRLTQGDFGQETRYDPYPYMAAQRWRDMGAKWLHVVDLDGAKNGVMGNKEHIIYITQKVDIPVQVGGGIRDLQTVADLLNAGVDRVILGTRAIEDRKFLKNMLAVYGEKICVSLDCTNGYVTTNGWVSATEIKATDLVLELEDIGLKWLIYTDIARDGVLKGPNFDQLLTMLSTLKKTKLIASGGIGSLDDVKKLSYLKGVEAAITGKAIYEGKLNYKEAVDFLNAQ